MDMVGLGRVLVVDDCEPDRMVIRRAIERLGARDVVEAMSGEEALSRLRGEPFELVVSDFSMGKMDGVRLLEVVRREHPAACRVLVTGHAHFDLALDAINRAGVHALLQKPLDLAALPAALERAFARAAMERGT